MLKKIAKHSVAGTLYHTRIDHMLGKRRGLDTEPLIICYHRVVEDFEEASRYSIPSMLVSTRTLEAQLDWLSARYTFSDLDSIAARVNEGRTFEKPVAAITFDDGYADVYQNAFPVLQKRGIPFAVFAVTDLVDTSKLAIHDELYLLLALLFEQWRSSGTNTLRSFINFLSLDEYTSSLLLFHARGVNIYDLTRLCLSELGQSQLQKLIALLANRVDVPDQVRNSFFSLDWDQLRHMSDTGVTIGSHTCSHALLVNESSVAVTEEVSASREVLEKGLGRDVNHFAYPDGRFNSMAVHAVASAGYKAAYTICMHTDPAFRGLTIPRRVLWEKSTMGSFGRFSPAIMSCQVNGIFEPAFQCKQHHWGVSR